MNPVETAMREYVTRRVAEGFFSEAEPIIEDAIDYVHDMEEVINMKEPDVERLARRLTREAVRAHKQEQKQWTEPTDCDRLDAAFDAMEKQGIVARQNFACCQNCGVSEIGDEIRQAQKKRRCIRGYVFYHMQDTEGAVEGGQLFLAYGSLNGKKANTEAVGRIVVDCLTEAGLTTQWNEESNTRICVTDIEWRRRIV